MNITEASAHCGLTIDTIRFYEKAGMMPRLSRDARGWRSFGADALEWLVILARLRATGMPLEDMRRFAVLAHTKSAGDRQARSERRNILERHLARLEQRRRELEACESYLKHKIAIYSGRTKS